ncbi:MAG: hypothetical protein MUF75_13440, partial [Bacteroidia bacterium]|nr:hypothetical protein [Bacteroidia bacterium]
MCSFFDFREPAIPIFRCICPWQNWGQAFANSNGTTITTGAPASIVMVSSDNQSGLVGTNDFTISIPQNGLITFNWNYTTLDGPSWDYPMYLLNGVATMLNGYSTLGSSTQSGSQTCIPVTQGQVFGFRMYSVDNVAGAATTTFSGFTFITSQVTITPASPSVCPGQTIALMATGGANILWSGGITNGVPFTPTAPAVYTVTSGSGACITASTVFVNYFAPIAISGPSTNLCANISNTLNVIGSTSYTWNTGLANAPLVITPTANVTFTASGTSTNGCFSTVIKSFTVDPGLPNVGAVSTNSANGACPGASVAVNGTGALSYSWSGGISNGVAFTPSITNSYTVTGTNACGSATAAITVSVHPIPPVTASATQPSVCTGNTVALLGGGAQTYTWSNAIPNGSPFFPSSTNSYSVIGTSALGCTATAVVTVTVEVTPILAPLATPSLICIGGSGTITATGANNYTWMPGNLNTGTIIITPTITTTYTLTKANSNCVDVKTITVFVNQLPNVFAISSSSVVCAGSSATLS